MSVVHRTQSYIISVCTVRVSMRASVKGIDLINVDMVPACRVLAEGLLEMWLGSDPAAEFRSPTFCVDACCSGHAFHRRTRNRPAPARND